MNVLPRQIGRNTPSGDPRSEYQLIAAWTKPRGHQGTERREQYEQSHRPPRAIGQPAQERGRHRAAPVLQGTHQRLCAASMGLVPAERSWLHVGLNAREPSGAREQTEENELPW